MIRLELSPVHHVSPDDVVRVIAVSDRHDVGAVGVVVGEDVLGPDDGDGEEDGEDPDGGDDLPAVAEGAEGAGVVGVDDHHEPLQGDGRQVEDGGRGGEDSEVLRDLAEDPGLVHLDREVVEELGGDRHHDQQEVRHGEGQQEQVGLPRVRVELPTALLGEHDEDDGDVPDDPADHAEDVDAEVEPEFWFG